MLFSFRAMVTSIFIHIPEEQGEGRGGEELEPWHQFTSTASPVWAVQQSRFQRTPARRRAGEIISPVFHAREYLFSQGD